MMLELIVAVDKKNGIGKTGKLAWHLSRDLQYFKKLTSHTKSSSTKNSVIMGRKTYESLPDAVKPLPGRINIVLSSQADYKENTEHVLWAKDWNTALILNNNLLQENKIERSFVIGGASLYKIALEDSKLSHIWLTKLYKDFNCDSFFPKLDLTHWQGIYGSNIFVDSSGFSYVFFGFKKT